MDTRIELPASADARQGGFVVDTAALGKVSLGDTVSATLHGWWGFEPHQGPPSSSSVPTSNPGNCHRVTRVDWWSGARASCI